MKTGGEFGIPSKISLLKELTARLSPRWAFSGLPLPHGLPRAEKLAEDPEGLPQALKAPAHFQRLSGPTEVGPSPKPA